MSTTTKDAVATNGDLETLPFELTDLDKQILAQTDEEYQPLSWEDVKRIIGRPAHPILPGFHQTYCTTRGE